MERIRDGVQQALGQYMGQAVLPAIAQHQQILDQMAQAFDLPGEFANQAAQNLRIGAASVAEQLPAMVESEFDPQQEQPEFRFPAWERAVQQNAGYPLSLFTRRVAQPDQDQQRLLREYQDSVKRLRTAFTPEGVQQMVGQHMQQEFGQG